MGKADMKKTGRSGHETGSTRAGAYAFRRKPRRTSFSSFLLPARTYCVPMAADREYIHGVRIYARVNDVRAPVRQCVRVSPPRRTSLSVFFHPGERRTCYVPCAVCYSYIM